MLYPRGPSFFALGTELLAVIRATKCVTIVENQAKLTTVEAAALLGVSRRFLVNLLERNEIPFHRVGTHRRIYASDLLEYKGRRDRNRGKLIRELAAAEGAEGLYDRQATRLDYDLVPLRNVAIVLVHVNVLRLEKSLENFIEVSQFLHNRHPTGGTTCHVVPHSPKLTGWPATLLLG